MFGFQVAFDGSQPIKKLAGSRVDNDAGRQSTKHPTSGGEEVMARSIEIDETERRLLARLVGEEWRRLDEIRTARAFYNDPIVAEQLEVEALQAKLR
jgi:hypothetical protein